MLPERRRKPVHPFRRFGYGGRNSAPHRRRRPAGSRCRLRSFDDRFTKMAKSSLGKHLKRPQNPLWFCMACKRSCRGNRAQAFRTDCFFPGPPGCGAKNSIAMVDEGDWPKDKPLPELTYSNKVERFLLRPPRSDKYREACLELLGPPQKWHCIYCHLPGDKAGSERESDREQAGVSFVKAGSFARLSG